MHGLHHGEKERAAKKKALDSSSHKKCRVQRLFPLPLLSFRESAVCKALNVRKIWAFSNRPRENGEHSLG